MPKDNSNWKALPNVAKGVARWTLNKSRIPPNWKDVKISLDKKNDLEAFGKDSKGRTVYLYSMKHRKKLASSISKRVRLFEMAYPKIQKRISRDADKVEEAAVLRLIDKTAFRVGSERDTGAEKQAYGATALNCGHVKIKGSNIKFEFDSKKGGHTVKEVTDKALANDLQKRCSNKSEKLFNTTDGEVRNYLKRIPGCQHLNIKDFRTFIGTTAAVNTIKEMPKPKNKSEFKKFRNQVGDTVAAVLGNTRPVALGSYIAPEVFEPWDRF